MLTTEPRVLLHCPICQYQYDAGTNGAPTRCPNGPAALVPGARTLPFTFSGHGEDGYVEQHRRRRASRFPTERTEDGDN